MSENISLVRSLYTAFATGDVPALLSRFDPTIRWLEAEGFPLSDRNPYVGPEAILQGVFARLPEDWDDFRVEVGELVGGGDCVTMLGRYKATCRRTGKPLDVQVSHLWILRNGKVVRFQQMVDTAAVARAMA